MSEARVRFCKPRIRGLATTPGSRHALGPWEWAARCDENGTSWTTGGRRLFSDALEVAVGHQREWAEVLR